MHRLHISITCLAITAVGCVSANKVSIHDEPRVPVRFESAEAMQTFYDALLSKELPTRNKPSRIHVGQTLYTAETRNSANAAFNHAVQFSDHDADGTISLPEAHCFALARTEEAH